MSAYSKTQRPLWMVFAEPRTIVGNAWILFATTAAWSFLLFRDPPPTGLRGSALVLAALNGILCWAIARAIAFVLRKLPAYRAPTS